MDKEYDIPTILHERQENYTVIHSMKPVNPWLHIFKK